MSDDPEPNTERASELGKASKLEKADVALGKKLAGERSRPATKAAASAGEIGDQGPLYALSAGLLIVGVASRDRRLAGSGISMLAAIGAADISKRLVKRFVRRTRPHVLLDEGRYAANAGGSDEKGEQSFPSGHTAGSIAAARALSREFPAAGALAGVAAVGIGISRLLRGAHWPLDVVGGAVVGLGAEEMSNRLLGFAGDALRSRLKR